LVPFAPIIAEESKAVCGSLDHRLFLLHLNFILANPANLETVQFETLLIVVIERFRVTLSTIADKYEAEVASPRGKLRIDLHYASIASRQKIGCG